MTGKVRDAEGNVERDREYVEEAPAESESVFLPPHSSTFHSLLGVDTTWLPSKRAIRRFLTWAVLTKKG